MEINQAIIQRRTIHLFSREKVPKGVIERSILAANQAPCHRRTFPWRFTSLGFQKRELLYQLYLTLKSANEPMEESNLTKMRAKFFNPSHLIVASQVCSENDDQRLEDYAACACAIQNMSLSLVSDGVGYKWSTGKITKNIETYQIAELDPSEEEIIGFIWIGYGSKPPSISRPSLNKIYRVRN